MYLCVCVSELQLVFITAGKSICMFVLYSVHFLLFFFLFSGGGGGGGGVFVPLIGHVCDIFVVVYFWSRVNLYTSRC